MELEKADKTMQLADMEREYLEAKDKIKKGTLHVIQICSRRLKKLKKAC